MANFKNQHPRKLRNIKLITEDSESYSDYITDLKLEKFHLRKSNQRSYADLISYPLEKTVREWAKLAGTSIDERILSFEALNSNNKYEYKFNEIDFIFIENNFHYLGEVKVSSSVKAINKASSQLRTNYNILKQAGYDIELLIVHIDLNYKNSEIEFHKFDEDFLNTEFTVIEDDEYPLNYLHLEPTAIFEWGVKNGIILDDSLLAKALEEAEMLHQKRVLRQDLLDRGVPKDEWPEDFKKDNKIEDDATYIETYGESASPNIIAEKLMEALKKRRL